MTMSGRDVKRQNCPRPLNPRLLEGPQRQPEQPPYQPGIGAGELGPGFNAGRVQTDLLGRADENCQGCTGRGARGVLGAVLQKDEIARSVDIAIVVD